MDNDTYSTEIRALNKTVTELTIDRDRFRRLYTTAFQNNKKLQEAYNLHGQTLKTLLRLIVSIDDTVVQVMAFDDRSPAQLERMADQIDLILKDWREAEVTPFENPNGATH